MSRRSCLLMVLCWTSLAAGAAEAAEWFVAVDGKPDAVGSKDAPWDLESTLSGRQKVSPGDTVWIAAGTCRYPDRKLGSPGYTVKLAGEKDKPIHVRAAAGARATIDGGLSVQPPSTWLWIRDLEILVSENFTMSREVKEPGSHPQSYNRPWGGLNVYAGHGCKYINLVIHDNAQGVSFWRGAVDSGLYGCVIYDNGWKAPDRGHGHAVYTQNQDGVKTIADCIMTGGYSYTMHAYGSKNAYVDNYLIEGNIAYDGGRFLVGGGRPSRGIRVLENILYRVPMQLGWSAPQNEDCEVRDNVILGSELIIKDFKQVTREGNLVCDRNNPPPRTLDVKIRPTRCDDRRANVAVYNGARQPMILLRPDDFLARGDQFRLMNPRDMYGKPVVAGKYRGGAIRVPMQAEFAALVLLK